MGINLKKILAIVGGILLLVVFFSAPWAVLILAGTVGVFVSIARFFYFRKRRRPEKAKASAMVLGVSVAAFAFGGFLSPETEKKTAESDTKDRTEQTTTKQTTASTKQKELSLDISETLETDDNGAVIIKGKTEPYATVYLASATSDKQTEADAEGRFELTHKLVATDEETLEVITERDGRKMTKQLLAKPSASFVAVKEAEAAKQAEELRLAEEAKKKQEEIDRLTKEAETAVALAEANQTSENVATATTAIAAIPEGHEGLTTRIAAVNSAIQTREQEAQQAAAAAETQQATETQYVDENGQGTIKGSNNGIYHIPGSRYYKQTTNPAAWFKTVSEAVAAGYRAPR